MKTTIITTLITLALIVAAFILTLSDYREGFIFMAMVMMGIVAFYTIVLRKGIQQCRSTICISAAFGLILQFFFTMGIVNNSMKKDGTYFMATKCTSRGISKTSKGHITYRLNFNDFIFKNGRKGARSIIVEKSTYDKANVNGYYMIAEPVIIDGQEKIWNQNPSEEDIQNFKNGVFIDAKGKASEELRRQYLESLNENILTLNPILSFILMIAIAVCSRFVIGIPPALTYLSTIALTFYLNYGNMFYGIMALMIMTASSTIIGEKLYLKMIKRKLEKFGGYITTGFYHSEMNFRGFNYWLENVKMRNGKQRNFMVIGDLGDIDKDRHICLGNVIVAVPRGLDRTPLVLCNYDDSTPDIERFKQGFAMKPEPIRDIINNIE